MEEFLASGYRGLTHIRNRIASGPTWYDVSPGEVRIKYAELLAQGVLPQDLYFSGMAPKKTIFQGEVYRSHYGLRLFYSCTNMLMRDGLKYDGKEVIGIKAVELIRHFLCYRSYDWLQYLLDTYEDHVVEFTTFSVNWGTIPGMNTVFWEVRKY